MIRNLLPKIPPLIVSDSVSLNHDRNGKESFIYCPDIEPAEIDEFKKTLKRKTDDEYILEKEYDITFERKHVKDLVHTMTSELKKVGTKVPLLILPFRPEHHDKDLKLFLNKVFINAMPIADSDAKEIVKKTNPHVLMSALKFIWCRLPGKAIIGWKSYTKFVKLEDNAGFPNKAFLEFMPNCLSSGAHASIVYDFFDLLVAFILRSKDNLMTAKKICKLCGLWAFSPVKNKVPGLPSFERGLYEWIPAGDAMFHLLLSFIKAMPPNGDLTKLPKLFQNLLKNSEYPPLPTSATLEISRHIQEIPIVTIRSNKPSKNPAELLTRVSKTLKFDDPTLFYTREDYLLLKRLFKEKDSVIDKLSSEGSRLLENLCLYDTDLINDGKNASGLKYKLLPGWSTDMTSRKSTVNESSLKDFFTAIIGRVSIEDYFIWAWLASLGIEETDSKKKTFGKSYIMEVELAEGFKKWVIVEEQDLAKDGYDLELEVKQEKLRELERKIQLAEQEAKKIKKEALMQAEKLEIERYEARKLLEDKNKQLASDSIPPPPVAKDYDNNEIPRGKSRKPPPSNDEKISIKHKIPERSGKRNIGTKINDVIRISLPDLEIDDEPFDTFLKFDSLNIADIDLNYETSPKEASRKMDYNDYANSSLGTTDLPNINTTTNTADILTSNNKRDDADLYSPYSSPTGQAKSPYSPKRNNVLPTAIHEKVVAKSTPAVSPQTNMPNPYPVKSMVNPSPPQSSSQYSPLSYSSQPFVPTGRFDPKTNQPITTSTPRVYQQEHLQVFNSPPRTQRLSNSPPRMEHLPKSSSPPPPVLNNHRSPSPVSPPEQRYQQRQPIVRPKTPDIDIKYNELEIPVLSPPKTSPVQMEKVNIYKSPINKKDIEDGFDELENDFKECLEGLDEQNTEPSSSQVRLRKAPPSMKSSTISQSSSAYPTTMDYEKQRGDRPILLSISASDHSRNSSNNSQSSVSVSRSNYKTPMFTSPVQSKQTNVYASKQYSPYSPQTIQNSTPQPQPGFSSKPPPPQGHSLMQHAPISYPQNQYPSSPQLPPVQQKPQQQIRPKSQPARPKQNQDQHYPPKSPGMKKSKTPTSSTEPGSGPNPGQYPSTAYPPFPMGYPPPQGYPGYPSQGQMTYPPHGYPGYPPIQTPGYPPMPTPGYPAYPSYPPQGYPGSPQLLQVAGKNGYSNNVINHMPPSNKIDKLHGPQALNKKNAREAFMSGSFGI